LRFDVIAADADLGEREGTLIELMIMICYDQIRINHKKSVQSACFLIMADVDLREREGTPLIQLIPQNVG
jgi:hypothetical protein